VDTDFCAMCGHDWCSVRISKEITLFMSGKEGEYAWDSPKVSQALSVEQRTILEQRGVLSPEEVHRLANKTRSTMGGDQDKAACHSDVAEEGAAQRAQAEQLDPSTLEPVIEPDALIAP